MQTNLLSLLLLPFRFLASALGVCMGFAYQVFVETNNHLTGISLRERFEQFPTYQTSQEEYLELRSRIEAFYKSTLEEHEAELLINGNDINSLRVVRGEVDSRRKSMGKVPEFFEIIDSGILERRFIYPFPTRFGFLDRVILIEYIKSDGNWIETRQIVEEQGKPVQLERKVVSQLPLTRSPLLFLILTENKSAEEKNNFVEVIRKIREISVSGSTLFLRT